MHWLTERKPDEQELRLLGDLLELAHDAVIVRDPLDSQVRFWNREAEAIYGYTRAEALGRVTHDLLATVLPEPPEAVSAALARDGHWAGELLHTRKDGERIVVSSRQALARDADDRPYAIIELNSDITDRKRAEDRLADMARLLERTQEISKTGGWQYDVGAGTLTLTDEVYRIYGIEPPTRDPELEQAIAAYEAGSRPIIRAALERAVREAEPYDREVRLVRADGERIWVRTIAQPVIEAGRVVRVDGNIADVTDRRLVEEEIRTLNAELEQRVAARTAELQRVNRELEAFAYSISHDLRAPLRAIDGFSTALLQDYAEALDAQGRHYLERVRAGALRMGHLIDGILQLSRVSRRPTESVPVDLSAVARDILSEMKSAEPARAVQAEVQGGLQAEADPTLVRIVLQNLISNAYKFTSKTPTATIRFGAVDQDGVAVYFVADNGAGFDMAHAERLFAPFHRLHRESEFPGDGIGLATVARTVQRHGGAIWGCGAVNHGATFHFTLQPAPQPLVAAEPPVAAAPQPPVAAAPQPPVAAVCGQDVVANGGADNPPDQQ